MKAETNHETIFSETDQVTTRDENQLLISDLEGLLRSNQQEQLVSFFCFPEVIRPHKNHIFQQSLKHKES